MGCDIHLYVEKLEQGKWTPADNFIRDDPDEDSPKGYLHVPYNSSYYSGRNYDLFAILADVRNGHGFAGIKTGEGFNPIAEPRGVPSDASEEYKEVSDGMGEDGHSHSYFTLRELLDYDWTQSTSKQGCVSFATWLQWSGWQRGQGFGPDNYSGGIMGQNIKHINADEMDALCAKARKFSGVERDAFIGEYSQCYAMATWELPYYRAAGSFIEETIPRLLKLAGGTRGLDDVRIVFFFDN